jgi:hypothetical protein
MVELGRAWRTMRHAIGYALAPAFPA